jgi:hypothetical protein
MYAVMTPARLNLNQSRHDCIRACQNNPIPAAFGANIPALTAPVTQTEPPSSLPASGLPVDTSAFSFTSTFPLSQFKFDPRCSGRFQPIPVPTPPALVPFDASFLTSPVDPTFTPNYAATTPSTNVCDVSNAFDLTVRLGNGKHFG